MRTLSLIFAGVDGHYQNPARVNAPGLRVATFGWLIRQPGQGSVCDEGVAATGLFATADVGTLVGLGFALSHLANEVGLRPDRRNPTRLELLGSSTTVMELLNGDGQRQGKQVKELLAECLGLLDLMAIPWSAIEVPDHQVVDATDLARRAFAEIESAPHKLSKVLKVLKT